MLRADAIRLQHMLDAAREAVSFVGATSRQDLYADRMRWLAVVRDVEIVGEAAAKVTEETKARYTSIPWNDIIGMRNRLIHGYFDIDIEVVWSTVTRDLPPLIDALELALRSAQ